ncbi:hypothetical protein ACQ4PT_007773 [Festuca glaucescens]
MVSWSSTVLDNIIEEIGYEMCGRIKVHYCIPFLTLARNGLRQLRDADDNDRMLTFVDIGHHFISLYLDHDDSLTARQWDDVVYYPVTTLPPVISPAKPSSHTEPESCVHAAAEEDVHAAGEEDVHVPLQVVLPDNVPGDQCIGARTRQRKRDRSQTVPLQEDIVDSDYDMNEGDDDLFEDNVVDADQEERHEEKSTKKSVKVKEKAAPKFEGKGKACKEENSEEEDLWGPESDDDTAPLRFKTFREVYLADPQFHVGQTFESVQLLRKAIQAYSCKHGKDIKLPVNDLKRLNGRCTEECSCTEVFGELQGRPGYEYEEFFKDSVERVVYDSREMYRGQLLAAVGMDPNDCIFPIVVAAVEVEDTANWTWFLDTLKADLGIEKTAPWTVMSDKQKRPFVKNMDPTPTPTSTFITAAQAMVNQVQASSSTIRQGELAQKLLAMQNEKDKAVEERKLAILEAKYHAEVKKAEATAKKDLSWKRRKQSNQKQEHLLLQLRGRREKLKKIQAAEKKRLAAEEKAALRAASGDAQSSQNADDVHNGLQKKAKKVCMFDELRAPARK